MKRYRVLLLVLFVGCAHVRANDHVEKDIFHGGIERSYFLHVPAKLDRSKSVPLVFALHGGGGLAGKFDRTTTEKTFYREADRLGFIVCCPQGLGKRWQDGRRFAHDMAKKEGPVPDDVDFILTILDRLKKEHRIDESSVFATGISNGGLMSYRLALDRSDIFAAVAPVIANLPLELRGKKLGRGVSVAIFNGTDDPMMPDKGGAIKLGRLSRKERGRVISTRDTFDHFSRLNGCQGKNPSVLLPDVDEGDGTRVWKTVHSGGKDGAKVVLYSVEDGGHTWPGGTQYLRERFIGKVCRDINASRLILEFFQAHRRGAGEK